jgi:hypothetical protein
MDLSRRPPALQEHRIPMAQGETGGAMVLSPDGKRVGMLVSRWPQSMNGQIQMELRTCGLDGEELKIHGKVEVGRPATDSRTPLHPRPRLPRWLPNGKRLSFEYRGRLYTIADP